MYEAALGIVLIALGGLFGFAFVEERAMEWLKTHLWVLIPALWCVGMLIVWALIARRPRPKTLAERLAEANPDACLKCGSEHPPGTEHAR